MHRIPSKPNDPEFIFKSAYLSGKRRYALNMVDREGMEVDKMVVMGLDITKSNFPPYFKGFGDELIKKIYFNVFLLFVCLAILSLCKYTFRY